MNRILRPVAAAFLSLCLVPIPARAENKLSLDDLGFSPSQTQSDPKLQALLHRRSRMLKTHQRLGLATLIPMAATVALAGGAEGGSKADRNRHMIAGMAAGGMYLATASFAIFAPEPPGETPSRGATKVHKALAFIHFPAMILAPIAGYQAKKQRDRGDAELHGLAKQHQLFAGLGAGGFAAAMLVVTINFGGGDK